MADANPTPEQRADFLVRRLENLIREGKNDSGGMSFSTWQVMARAEIANAIVDAASKRRHEERAVNRLIVTASSTFITIGFWGMVVSLDKAYQQAGAAIMFVAGIALFLAAGEGGLRRFFGKRKAAGRIDTMRRIEDFDRQIKRYERERKAKIARIKEEQGSSGRLG